MLRKIKYTLGLVLLFTIAGNAAEIMKYAGEVLSIGVGARALGMGGAYVAVKGDVTSGYWNPAGLSEISYPEISAMHSRRFEGLVNYDYGAIAAPFRDNQSLSLSFIRTAVDDIPFTTLPRKDLPQDASYYDTSGRLVHNIPYIERIENYADYAFFFSYAKKKSSRFSYGANVKFIRKGVGDNSAWGFGFDLGAIWNAYNDLNIGVNFQDVTTTVIAWDTGTKELVSPTLKLGMAYPLWIKWIQSQLLIAADTDMHFEGRDFAADFSAGPVSNDFRLGTELLLRQVVALRLGRSDIGSFSAGAGIRLPKLDIDYAFMDHDDLGSTHRISLRLRFEEDRFARK